MPALCPLCLRGEEPLAQLATINRRSTTPDPWPRLAASTPAPRTPEKCSTCHIVCALPPPTPRCGGSLHRNTIFRSSRSPRGFTPFPRRKKNEKADENRVMNAADKCHENHVQNSRRNRGFAEETARCPLCKSLWKSWGNVADKQWTGGGKPPLRGS